MSDALLSFELDGDEIYRVNKSFDGLSPMMRHYALENIEEWVKRERARLTEIEFHFAPGVRVVYPPSKPESALSPSSAEQPAGSPKPCSSPSSASA